MSYLNILHISGLDVKFGHFSSSTRKLIVFHIFAQWVTVTQNKKDVQTSLLSVKSNYQGLFNVET